MFTPNVAALRAAEASQRETAASRRAAAGLHDAQADAQLVAAVAEEEEIAQTGELTPSADTVAGLGPADLLGAEEALPAVVEVSSRITFDADYDSILSSDFARSEFEAEFRLSMAAALGDGRSIRSEQVLIQDIHHGSIIVEFWLEVPPEEAERVVGLVNELRQRDAAVALHVGRRRLAANTATISKPFKRAGPVLALMNEIEAEKEKLAADDAEAEEVQSQLLFEMQANRLAQAVREKRQLDGSSSAAVERESHVALDSHVITAAHARLGNAMGENALAELEARYTNAQQRLKGKALQTELANLDAAKDMLLVRDLHLLLAACYFTKSQLHLCVGSCADLATCWSRRGTAARGYASRLRNGLGSTACRLVKEGSRSCSRV